MSLSVLPIGYSRKKVKYLYLVLATDGLVVDLYLFHEVCVWFGLC